MAILRAAAYDILGYGHMIADNDRTHAYARALRRVIRPDSVVIDLGTGVGLFAWYVRLVGGRLAGLSTLRMAPRQPERRRRSGLQGASHE